MGGKPSICFDVHQGSSVTSCTCTSFGTQISINIFVHITLTIELHVLTTLQLILTCIYACIISPPPLNNDKKKQYLHLEKESFWGKNVYPPAPPPPTPCKNK